MKRFLPAFVVVTFFIILTNCFNSRWTNEQRKEFETKCGKTKTFNNMVVLFKGFDNNEFDSVVVKEYKDSTLLDKFRIYVEPSQNPDEKERIERSATIQRTLNINYSYQFIIQGQDPYLLANMKMVMHAQYTMNSEGWGCEMGDYTIDGIRFEKSFNPTFIKRAKSEKK